MQDSYCMGCGLPLQACGCVQEALAKELEKMKGYIQCDNMMLDYKECPTCGEFVPPGNLSSSPKSSTISNDRLRKLATRLYNNGYKAGHHDTVEGQYVDVLRCEMDEYHEIEANEILQSLIADTLGGKDER